MIIYRTMFIHFKRLVSIKIILRVIYNFKRFIQASGATSFVLRLTSIKKKSNKNRIPIKLF